MPAFDCPNCGDRSEPMHPGIRAMDCPSCGTSLFVDDDAFRLAGEAGVMYEAPMLFDLGDTVDADGERFEPVGHARFSYGPGWWDEFAALDGNGRPVWVSVDEGDVAVQVPLPPQHWPQVTGRLRLGRSLSTARGDFTVTEIDEAECIARRGAFFEPVMVGDRYQFVNAQSERGELLSGEIWSGGQAWFVGRWVDPFDVKTVRSR